jgi:hypothetical protein
MASGLAGGQPEVRVFRVESCEATTMVVTKVWLRQGHVSRLRSGVFECLRGDLFLL